MPLKVTPAAFTYYLVNLSAHSRWTMMTYMFVKGMRWAARSNLSLVLVVTLFFASVEAFYQATLLVQIVENCVIHMRCLYASWIIYTILLDMVLYYRAWCISSTKRSWQKYISIFMTVGHAACLIIDADHSLTATYDIPNVGCVSYPGWPRSVLGIFSTINDIFQVVLFCSPLLRAVHNSTEVRRDTTAYRRMIMKATVCLVICVVMNITYAILVATNFQIISLLFSDIALTFQVLSACEIQFNSHRETDKASLGGILGYRSPMIRQKDMPMQSSPIVSAGGGVYTSESAASSTHIGEHSPVHVLISH